MAKSARRNRGASNKNPRKRYRAHEYQPNPNARFALFDEITRDFQTGKHTKQQHAATVEGINIRHLEAQIREIERKLANGEKVSLKKQRDLVNAGIRSYANGDYAKHPATSATDVRDAMRGPADNRGAKSGYIPFQEVASDRRVQAVEEQHRGFDNMIKQYYESMGYRLVDG